MEHKLRYAWWFVLAGLVIFAIWKLFLPHGASAYVQKTDTSREIIVYVAGAVEKPGLVHLAPDARLADALKQVSPLVEANLDSMNPAERLKDGQKVNVPYKTLAPAPGSAVVGNPANTSVGAAPVTNPISVATPTPPATPAGGLININTAGAAELDKLSGVGPVLAERIIQYRTEHGPFAKSEDLKNVSGIGDKTYDKMAAQVSVSP
ncbi:MAG TPA: competence protein ComEA [Desulfosporosinus sp.]|jgi:competence protein ComEA|nr:competence protein ComEA [Desulfosporosinus sp.]